MTLAFQAIGATDEARKIVSEGIQAAKPNGDPDHAVRLQYLKSTRDLNADSLNFIAKVEAILNRTLAHEAEMSRPGKGVGGDPWMTPEAAAEDARRKARAAAQAG